MLPATGPYVNAAYFCRPTLLPDGKYAAPPDNCFDVAERRDDGSALPMLPFHATLFLMFCGGRARGRVDLTIVCERPNGAWMDPATVTFAFVDEHTPLMRFLDLDLALERAGTYWFLVLLGDRELTRVPLRVRYLPA